MKVNQTLIFTNKSFFNEKLGFVRPLCFLLDDIERFYQLIVGSYKSDKHINIAGIEKIHLKCDCINASIVNGIRESVLNSFAFDQPTKRKKYKEPRMKFFRKLNKSVLSRITFYLEDDDHKPVHFHKETVSFTSQLI